VTGQTSLFPPEPAPDPLLCWLWLSQVLGPASLHAGKVLDAFGGAQEAWEARETEEFRQAAGDTAFKRAVQLDAEGFHTLVMQCDALRVRILPFDDPDYPLAFSRIPDMPLVLYCTGNPRWLNEPGAGGLTCPLEPTCSSASAIRVWRPWGSWSCSGSDFPCIHYRNTCRRTARREYPAPCR